MQLGKVPGYVGLIQGQLVALITNVAMCSTTEVKESLELRSVVSLQEDCGPKEESVTSRELREIHGCVLSFAECSNTLLLLF